MHQQFQKVLVDFFLLVMSYGVRGDELSSLVHNAVIEALHARQAADDAKAQRILERRGNRQ